MKGSTTMNLKKSLLPYLLICTTLVIGSCAKGIGFGGGVPGSGNVQTEKRHPGAFETISLDLPPADIIIQQGEEETVEIEAEDNLIPQISTELVSGRLTVKNKEPDWNDRVNPSKPVKLTITAKNLKEIDFSAGVGSLEVNDLQSDRLKMVLSGGAQVRLNGIQVDLLDSVLSGAGDIQASGTADEIKLILSGLGNFNAIDLKSNKANIELSGMGGATVRVEEELTATITGAGSVIYVGSPHVKQNVTGAGSVQPADQDD